MKTKVLLAAVAVAFVVAVSSCGNKKADATTATADSCCATMTEQVADTVKTCCKSGEAACDSTKACDKAKGCEKACDKK